LLCCLKTTLDRHNYKLPDSELWSSCPCKSRYRKNWNFKYVLLSLYNRLQRNFKCYIPMFSGVQLSYGTIGNIARSHVYRRIIQFLILLICLSFRCSKRHSFRLSLLKCSFDTSAFSGILKCHLVVRSWSGSGLS